MSLSQKTYHIHSMIEEDYAQALIDIQKNNRLLQSQLRAQKYQDARITALAISRSAVSINLWCSNIIDNDTKQA